MIDEYDILINEILTYDTEDHDDFSMPYYEQDAIKEMVDKIKESKNEGLIVLYFCKSIMLGD